MMRVKKRYLFVLGSVPQIKALLGKDVRIVFSVPGGAVIKCFLASEPRVKRVLNGAGCKVVLSSGILKKLKARLPK
ncbi:hypothetical protein AUJ14_04925 [Candidatus Micrarchaeota archaeon CG1_02_55_22]|nr:MAG: hypothetical protein AUJ14_04925 [Candidatus Micrarchaeota archaeon CG1_02_55_22]